MSRQEATFRVRPVLVACFSFAVWFAVLPSEVVAADFTFKGDVRDDLGKLVVGATVTAEGKDVGTSSSVSNAWGEYEITGLKPGRYTIFATANGQRSGSVEIKVMADEEFEYVHLIVPPISKSKVAAAECGPFPSDYEEIVSKWHSTVEKDQPGSEGHKQYRIESIAQPQQNKETAKIVGCWAVHVSDASIQQSGGNFPGGGTFSINDVEGRMWWLSIKNGGVVAAFEDFK
ncbi:MAG: carboxypeptidase-like regulatory domain-containing protein [Terracidiphilus sp.]